ncbi:aminotransferase class IV [uncultured Clostridium sp.]|uniref:aminotransferase class IV n=1 Tax=uncultured Clostridium sp. TaxID=59620 RepID=UPI0025D8FD68|nr:aminotransferase class IV [uncultured Clostridium sp.]
MEEKVIYEVLRIIDGKPVFLEAHIKRMENSFKLVGEKFPLNYNDIFKQISELVRNENKEIGNIKLTYGLNSKEFKVFFINHSYPTDEMYEKGVKTILYFGERTNPNAKIVNDDFRSKVNAEIEKNKAFEAVLVDRNGFITEGSKSNIFMVKGKELITSPVKAVLPGVTRGEIIKLAQKIGIKVREEEFNYKDIDKLDGMFISGTSPKVLPISHVGEIKLNPQNDIINQISQEYNNEIKRYLAK